VAEYPGTTPEQEKVEATVRAVVFDLLFDVVFDRALAAVPWLGYPVIKQVFSFVLRKLLSVSYEGLRELVMSSAINAKVQADRKAFEAAAERLRIEIELKTQGEKLEQAKIDFRNRFRDLVRYPR
jgi:hypothetical protein